MSVRHLNVRAGQQGIVLISSLLLLLVVTILALAMFRSMGLGEKISGNMREKERALHAAVVAQQYAEWWLSSSGNASLATTSCAGMASANASSGNVLICSNAIDTSPATVPWTAGGTPVGFTYFPNAAGPTAMSFVAAGNGSFSNTYYKSPAFYIQYIGAAADHNGNVYRIDAVGYGGNALSVAVVESMYEIGSAVKCVAGPGCGP
jgi:type IV pilus assembly protein PilX